MVRNEQTSRSTDLPERRPRSLVAPPREHSEPRTIVIRQGSVGQSLAFLSICLLLLVVVLLGHQAQRSFDVQNQQASATLARVERKIQNLESGIAFDSRRKYMLLGMRDHIIRVNPKVSLRDAYRYAELALDASERYPAVDPLLLLAIGIVESGYDPRAKSHADARGLYQIWPSTGRLLVRTLGWNYDESTLYDPEKNTQAAALYLDVLFATYSDPQMVLAEYNGGPLNAGYFHAGTAQLSPETRSYVPKVLELHNRLKVEFEKGVELQPELMHRDAQRQGKTLESGRAPTGGEAAGPGRRGATSNPATPGTGSAR